MRGTGMKRGMGEKDKFIKRGGRERYKNELKRDDHREKEGKNKKEKKGGEKSSFRWQGVRCCKQRRHKSVEGKTFWAQSYQSVSSLLTYIYVYTYVYAVLSGGTRGCCGLIYRLSLPWKPRRDRLARHPHIRVDSLLYPLSLPLTLILPFLILLYTYCLSLSLFSTILIVFIPFSFKIRSFLSCSLPAFLSIQVISL